MANANTDFKHTFKELSLIILAYLSVVFLIISGMAFISLPGDKSILGILDIILGSLLFLVTVTYDVKNNKLNKQRIYKLKW